MVETPGEALVKRITLRGHERRGIGQLYRDALAGGEAIIKQQERPVDLPMICVEDKVIITPYEYARSKFPDYRGLSCAWVIKVTDPDAPGTIKDKAIFIANDEVPRPEWVAISAAAADCERDMSDSDDMPTKQLSVETARDLVVYLRTLSHADRLRELTTASNS